MIGSDSSWYTQLRQTLIECHLQVLRAASTQEAAEHAHWTRARLVVLGIRMPVVHSLRICAQIRSLPEYALVPIVLLGGRLDAEHQQAAAAAGATRLVALPVSIFALKDVVLPLLGADPPPPAPAMRWEPKQEPRPVFGEHKAFDDGRRLAHFGQSATRRTDWHR